MTNSLLNLVAPSLVVAAALIAYGVTFFRQGFTNEKGLPRLFLEILTIGSAFFVLVGIAFPGFFAALAEQKFFLMILAFSTLMHAIQYIANVVSPSHTDDSNLGNSRK